MDKELKKKISVFLLTCLFGNVTGDVVSASPLVFSSYDTEKHFYTPQKMLLEYHNYFRCSWLYFDNRLKEWEEKKQCYGIGIGSKIDIDLLRQFMASEAYFYALEYGEIYGIDPWLLIALAYQESNLCHDEAIPGGIFYNGYGVGLTQQESPSDEKCVTAYNYVTKEYDTVFVNMENASNLKTNIQIGAMKLQCYLLDRNNHIFLALQTYNYGTPMVNKALELYGKETGRAIEEITNDRNDIGWLKYITDIHENPSKYGLSGNYFGDDLYIQHVLEHYLGKYIYLRSIDKEVILDLETFIEYEIELFNNERFYLEDTYKVYKKVLG